MLNWITNNMEWIFSGVGAAIVAAIAAWLFNDSRKTDQRQSSGSNSINIQAGKDIRFRREE